MPTPDSNMSQRNGFFKRLFNRNKYNPGFIKVSNNAVGNLADHSINTSMENIQNATLFNPLNPTLNPTGIKLFNKDKQLSLYQNNSVFNKNNGLSGDLTHTGADLLGVKDIFQNFGEQTKDTTTTPTTQGTNFGGSAFDWKFKKKDADGNVIGETDKSGMGAAIGTGLAIAGQVGDNFLNKSYKGNQGAYVSGAWALNNEMAKQVNNTNTTIASTDFNDAKSQFSNLNSQLGSQKTKTLSGGQIGGMAGVGAAKGASAGAAFGPWGCVCKGTRVIKNNGEFVNIEDLNQDDGIIGFGNNQIQKQTIFAFKPIDIKECVRLTFDNGDYLECSVDHPIYSTLNGRANRQYINGVRKRVKEFEFRQACELSVGDKVATPDKINIWGEESLPYARLIGLLIGDGCYDIRHGVRLYSPDKEIWDYIESNNLGYKLNDKYNYNVEFRAYKIKDYQNTLRKLGILGQTGNKKTLIKDLYKYNLINRYLYAFA